MKKDTKDQFGLLLKNYKEIRLNTANESIKKLEELDKLADTLFSTMHRSTNLQHRNLYLAQRIYNQNRAVIVTLINAVIEEDCKVT